MEDFVGKVYLCPQCQVCKFTREALALHRLQVHGRELETSFSKPGFSPSVQITNISEEAAKRKRKPGRPPKVNRNKPVSKKQKPESPLSKTSASILKPVSNISKKVQINNGSPENSRNYARRKFSTGDISDFPTTRKTRKIFRRPETNADVSDSVGVSQVGDNHEGNHSKVKLGTENRKEQKKQTSEMWNTYLTLSLEGDAVRNNARNENTSIGDKPKNEITPTSESQDASSNPDPEPRSLVSAAYDSSSATDSDSDDEYPKSSIPDQVFEANPPLNLADVELALAALVLAPESAECADETLYNDILVSTDAAKGQVVVLYTGMDADTKRYVEWRQETFQRIRRACAGRKRKLSKTTEVKLRIPRSESHIISVGEMTADLHSILNVITGQKMLTTLLDAYLTQKVLNHNSTAQQHSGSDIINFECLSVHFLPVHDRDWAMDTLTPQMKYFPRTDFRQSILIAPLFACDHFYLAVLDFPKKQIHVYDSSWQFLPIDFRFHHVRVLLKILIRPLISQDAEGVEGWDIFFHRQCAQQPDEFSCGCFVIFFVNNFLQAKFKMSEVSVGPVSLQRIKWDIARTLLPTTDVGRELFEAITC